MHQACIHATGVQVIRPGLQPGNPLSIFEWYEIMISHFEGGWRGDSPSASTKGRETTGSKATPFGPKGLATPSADCGARRGNFQFALLFSYCLATPSTDCGAACMDPRSSFDITQKIHDAFVETSVVARQPSGLSSRCPRVMDGFILLKCLCVCIPCFFGRDTS